MNNHLNNHIAMMRPLCFLLLLFMFSYNSYSQDHKVELSHYLFPEFTQGQAFLKSGVQQTTMLNYNSLTEEMVFQDRRGRVLAISEESMANTDSIVIHGRRFVPIGDRFLELLYDSDYQVFAEHKCRVDMPGKPVGYGSTSRTSSVRTISSLQSDGVYYQLTLPDDYKVHPFKDYWIKKEGELTQFTNMRQLRRMYRNQRAAFNDFVSEHNVTYDDPESLILLINYLEKGLE